jgi:hypothetical protein
MVKPVSVHVRKYRAGRLGLCQGCCALAAWKSSALAEPKENSACKRRASVSAAPAHRWKAGKCARFALNARGRGTLGLTKGGDDCNRRQRAETEGRISDERLPAFDSATSVSYDSRVMQRMLCRAFDEGRAAPLSFVFTERKPLGFEIAAGSPGTRRFVARLLHTRP